MKNLKSILGILFLMFSVLSNAQQLTSNTYDYLGKIHNQALDNFVKNFKDKEANNVDEAVNYIKEFNNNFYINSSLNNEEKENATSYNNKFRYFVSENDFYDYLSSNSNSYLSLSLSSKSAVNLINNESNISPNEDAFSQLISITKLKGLIDDYEYSKLLEIKKMVIDNKTNKLSISDLDSKLKNISKEFDSKGYKISNKNGHILAIILSISTNSISWWQNNSSLYSEINTSGKGGPNPSYYEEIILVAPWIAADVGGAIIGATVGAVSSYASSGEVSGTAMGIGALAGAVTGSTGAAGKLGRAIFSIFK